MNYLELVQRVGRNSGATPITIAAVAGQTGRAAKIVEWTDDAYRQIQVAHRHWRWLQSEFQGALAAATQRYAYNAAGFIDVGTNAAIARFSRWSTKGDETDIGFSIYRTATGVSDEGLLHFLDWETFYSTQLRGTPTAPAKPQYFSVTPDDKLIFSPVPDAIYTVRGPYRKSAQALVADATIPEMPVDFHDLIVDVALIMLGTHDEAAPQIPLWRLQKISKFITLEREQLPEVRFGRALA